MTSAPPGRMPQTISALARAMFSRLPSMPICEVPTFVMTAMSGRAQRDRRSIWPRPSMPISTTRASVSRGASDGEGQADEVVEVSGRRVDAVAPRQQGGKHVLGGRLADGSGDAHHARAEAVAPPGGEVEHERGGVVGPHDRRAPLLRGGANPLGGVNGHYDAAGAGLEGRRHERVAVRARSPGTRRRSRRAQPSWNRWCSRDTCAPGLRRPGAMPSPRRCPIRLSQSCDAPR